MEPPRPLVPLEEARERGLGSAPAAVNVRARVRLCRRRAGNRRLRLGAPAADSRAAMLGAATMTGVAFSNGGLIHVHTYAEVLGDLTHLPHGRLIGLMLPHVLEWSAIGCTDKLATIGRALGEKVDGLSARDGAERALAAVRRLNAEVEMTEPLQTHKVTEDTLRIAAERVFAQHAARSATGPRGFRSPNEVLDVLLKAY